LSSHQHLSNSPEDAAVTVRPYVAAVALPEADTPKTASRQFTGTLYWRPDGE
jgi:hypothetical protein